MADLEQALWTSQRSSDHITDMASVRDWCCLLVSCQAIKPAYGDIKDCVREAIVTRHWPPGGRPMSPAELSPTFFLAILARGSWWKTSAAPAALLARFAPRAPPPT